MGDPEAAPDSEPVAAGGKWRYGRIAMAIVLVALMASMPWLGRARDPIAAIRRLDRAGEAGEAARRALEWLERHPDDARVARLAGRALCRLGEPGRAEPFLRIALDAGWAEADDWRLLAEAWRRIGRPGEALAAAERAGESPRALAMIGSIHREQGRPREAIAALEHVLRLDPTLDAAGIPFDDFWRDFAAAGIDAGDPSKVRALLRRTLRNRELTKQRRALLWELVGLTGEVSGELDAARRAWRESIRLDPSRPGPRLGLGKLALIEGRYQDALDHLERAAALDPEAPGPPYSAALALERLGRVEEAEEARRRFRRLRELAGPPTTGMGARSRPAERGPQLNNR